MEHHGSLKTYTLPPLAGRILLVAFLGLLVALVLLQANPLTTYPSRDGGIYAYIGSVVRAGGQPYIDAWESKPPGIFYLDAFALWIGKGYRWGIWLVEFAFLFAAAWIGYRLMKGLWQASTAIFGTAAWLWALNRVLSGGNYTEEYPLLFNFLALYVFWLGTRQPKNALHDLVLGLTLALSFLFRPNNVGVQISIGLAWIILLLAQRKPVLLLRKLALMAAGAAVILAGTAAYFWARGVLPALIDAAFVYNFAYTSGHADLAASLIPGFSHLGFVTWIALAGYFTAGVLLVRSLRAGNPDVMALLLVIGWPVEMLLSAVSGRGYGHYFMSWLPVVALLCGLAFSQLAPQVFAPKVVDFLANRTNLLLAILLVLCAAFSWNGLATYSRTFSRLLLDRGAGIEKLPPVVQYVRANTGSDDRVLVWGGGTGLNFMARRLSPTAYTFYPLFISSPLLKELDDGFFRDVTTRPPVLIVDGYVDAPDDVLSIDPQVRAAQIAAGKGQPYRPPHLDQFFDFVRTSYALETMVDGYAIYRLDRP